VSDGYLIDLPIGTEKRGLHLAPPHGELIFQGRKTAIAKARPFDVSGPWILISGGMAYGTMDVALPQPVSAEEFDKRFPEHRVTGNERKRWWPGVDPLYLSHITYFEGFEKPYPITVVSGMQTVVEQVEFKAEQPPCLGDHCDEVRMVLEEVKLAKGEKQKQVAAEQQAEDLEDLEDAASAAEGLEAYRKGETVPWEDVKERLLASSKEDEQMPYDPENPPEKLHGLPEKAQRIFVHTYNSCMAEHNDEGKCHQMGYGAVKNAGYYQAEDGAWHEKEAEKRANDEDEDADGCKAEGILEQSKKAAPERECVCSECGATATHEAGTPCTETPCPKCGGTMYGRSKPEASTAGKSIGAIPWLRQKFEGVLTELRALVGNGEATVQPTDDRRFVAFKTFRAKDGRPWLLTWTTNAFEDKDRECFSTKSIDEFVTRHESYKKKGEFWFWHLPGAKMGDIRWQAMVGRFLVEVGPFDDTPMGRKWAEFFSRHSTGHPSLAPDGWGTSHGYFYEVKDREDGVYDWFDKFETTVLPLAAASNPYTSMEVYAMNDAQKSALELIGSELGVGDLVNMVIETGEQRTKELEAQGTRFKAAAEEAPPAEAAPVTEPAEKAEPVAEQETPVETKVVAEPVEPVAEKAEEAAEKPTEEGQGSKAILELAQHLSASMGLDVLTKTLQDVQSTVQAVAAEQQAQAARLAKLEDIGVSPTSPLIPLPRGAFWQASKLGQEPSDKSVAAAQPKVPEAIIEMAKRIPA
jgi:cation transport regulator ChaB